MGRNCLKVRHGSSTNGIRNARGLDRDGVIAVSLIHRSIHRAAWVVRERPRALHLGLGLDGALRMSHLYGGPFAKCAAKWSRAASEERVQWSETLGYLMLPEGVNMVSFIAWLLYFRSTCALTSNV